VDAKLVQTTVKRKSHDNQGGAYTSHFQIVLNLATSALQANMTFSICPPVSCVVYFSTTTNSKHSIRY